MPPPLLLPPMPLLPLVVVEPVPEEVAFWVSRVPKALEVEEEEPVPLREVELELPPNMLLNTCCACMVSPLFIWNT
jgi:hypothetical protein